MKRVRDEIRTHTAERPLPPQSSVSTNSTTRTSNQSSKRDNKKNRAKNGTRTRDPNLGKVVLYQLSYFRNLISFTKTEYFIVLLERKTGLEPATPTLARLCSTN